MAMSPLSRLLLINNRILCIDIILNVCQGRKPKSIEIVIEMELDRKDDAMTKGMCHFNAYLSDWQKKNSN